MEFNLQHKDLAKVDLITAYPFIPTYHAMGRRGLEEVVQVSFDKKEKLFYSEKIEGVQVRVIVLPNGEYLINCMGEFLYASDDFLFNTLHGIVPLIKSPSHYYGNLHKTSIVMGKRPCSVDVLYLEFYGGDIPNGRRHGSFGYRLFDIARIPMPQFRFLLGEDTREINTWRQKEGLTFLPYPLHGAQTGSFYFGPLLIGQPLPESLCGTLHWLSCVAPVSNTDDPSGDDGSAQRPTVRPAGIIVRNATRSKIAQICFEDYEKSIKF